MQDPVARIYIRVVLPDGSRPYCNPVYTANQKLRAQYALIDGKAHHHPEGVYCVRYTSGGKRRWEPVGADPSLALVRLQLRDHALQAESFGIPVPQTVVEPVPQPRVSVEPVHRSLRRAAADYLAEVQEHKSKKTYAAYSCTLKLILESCMKATLEQLDRKDLLAFVTYLKGRGNGARTVRNRIDFLQIFLHHFGMSSILKGKNLPKFTDKLVSAYSAEDMRRLLAAADREEYEVLTRNVLVRSYLVSATSCTYERGIWTSNRS